MRNLKVILNRRKIASKVKGGDLTILRDEVKLVANGPNGARAPIPQRQLRKLGWKAGDEVVVTVTDDKKWIVEPPKTNEKAS